MQNIHFLPQFAKVLMGMYINPISPWGLFKIGAKNGYFV